MFDEVSERETCKRVFRDARVWSRSTGKSKRVLKRQIEGHIHRMLMSKKEEIKELKKK